MSIDKTNTFDYMRKALMNLDPVSWVQTHLTIDGAPFKLIGNGYKPFVDIYRYIAIKALEKNSKPVVILKSRQTGGTTIRLVRCISWGLEYLVLVEDPQCELFTHFHN
jgi:hypothetical protein